MTSSLPLDQYLPRLLSNDPTLTTLHLNNLNISDESAECLATALTANSILTSLTLSRNKVTDKGAGHLTAALTANFTITTLHLYNTILTDERAGRLSTALNTNSSLTKLYLDHNRITDEGIGCLATALAGNSTLIEFYISSNNISDEGAGCLATALVINSTLTTLWLGGNSITDEGARCLATALATNSTLSSLFLANNKITDEGAGRFATALTTNFTLASLNLDRNYITNEGTARLNTLLSIRNQFGSVFSSTFPRMASLTMLASHDERIRSTHLSQTLFNQFFQQSYAEIENIQTLNEIKKQPNSKNGLIVELEELVTAPQENNQSLLTRLREMRESVAELYCPQVLPQSPVSSSSSSIPSCSSSASSSDFNVIVALQNDLISLIQSMLDRYPALMTELRKQESSLKALEFGEYSQSVSTVLSQIRDNDTTQTLMAEAIMKMNQYLAQSLNKVHSQIQQTETEAELLKSVLVDITKVAPFVESKMKESQELRESIAAENEAEIVQLRNLVGRSIQSLATSYREQIKVYEGRRQSRQTEHAESARLGLTSDLTKLDQDIADIEVQLQTPKRLLDEVTQLASLHGVATTPPTMSLDELRRIGTLAHFELDHRHIEMGDKIGEGGMAGVFRGKFFGSLVAIKLLKNEDFMAVQKEVKNWCHLHHPHILGFIGYSQPGPLIVMELMDNSLAELLYFKSTLVGRPHTLDEPPLLKISFDQRFYMISSIANGLYFLHNREIPMVHRDIKSLNILVRRFTEDNAQFDIKIADFGATRTLATLGQTTVGIKTPRWAAPELYHAGSVTTFKSDVFAYAMVIYEILTRRLPFDDLKTDMELVEALRKQDRPSITLDHLDQINPEKVYALVGLMKEGWCEDPISRPSAEMILAKLEDIQKIPTIIPPNYSDIWDQDFTSAFPPAANK